MLADENTDGCLGIPGVMERVRHASKLSKVLAIFRRQSHFLIAFLKKTT